MEDLYDDSPPLAACIGIGWGVVLGGAMWVMFLVLCCY